MGKEENWHLYFNPCGQEVVRGFVNQTCVSPDCGRFPCLAKSSWHMAKFVLEGSDIQTEKEELLGYLDSQMGNAVVSPSGETVVVGQDNKAELAEAVTGKAERILEGMEECMTNTIPISDEFIATCTPEQIGILESLGILHTRMEIFSGNQNEAVLLAAEMREKLGEALDAGLGNVDLIARKALVYGLGDQILEIDSTGTIFVGTLENIKPAS